MSAVGLPATAKRYWKSYSRSAVGTAVLTTFAGAFGAVVVLLTAPDAMV